MKLSYKVLHSVYDTEKTNYLKSLKDKNDNKCIRNFTQEKHVFLVDLNATKIDVKNAFEQMFGSKVSKVNTIVVKPKAKRAKGKGCRAGKTKMLKKAIITLAKGSAVDVDFLKSGKKV